jgi:hypothetical protein
MLTPTARKWLYGIAIAINVCLMTWGAINHEQRAALDTLFTAVFGIAMLNVPDSDGNAEQSDNE